MRPAYPLFFLYSGYAVPGRFKSIFYESLAQRPSRIGFLLAFETLASIPALPFFGHLSDRLRSREIVIYFCQTCSVVVFFLMIIGVPSFNLLSGDASFLFLSIVAMVFGFFYQPLFAMAYTVCIDFLNECGEGALKFGGERLWGCVGYSTLTVVLGVLLDIPEIGIKAVFACFLICSLLFSASIFLFERSRRHERRKRMPYPPTQTSVGQNCETSTQHVPIWGAIQPVIFAGGIQNTLFFLLFLNLCIGMALVDNFLFLFLTKELHASNFLCSTTLVVSLIFEIPVYAQMSRMLQHISASRAMGIAALAYAVRVIGYTMVPVPWLVLFFEPLHGLMFATIDGASVAYISNRAVKGGEACAQSILAAVRATGFTVATIGGGIIIEWFGARVLYWSSATLVLVSAAAFFAAGVE